MKATFARLSEEKRRRIIEAGVAEFGEHGYEKGSTDGIIRRSGISKGGLYEYIRSKEELFLFVLDDSYGRLYGYLKDRIARRMTRMPADILERFHLAATVAIDFYIKHPKTIRFIAQCGRIEDPVLAGKIQKVFLPHFLGLFGDVDTNGLRYGKDKVLDLLRWLLVKTRNDFLAEIAKKKSVTTVKKSYLRDWDFILGTLRNGIYRT